MPTIKPYFLLIFLACCCSMDTANAMPKDRPNIVVILVDDMGWSDIGCYGSEIPTPNLDALANGGLRFTQHYNTGRCCPTRAALLTGLYSHQTGIGHMTTDDRLPGYQGRLNDSCVTIAEVLKPAGYFTAMTGKWHVGQNLGVTPWGRGFERSLNAAAGGFYYAKSEKAKLFLNGTPLNDDDPRLPKDWYSTDLWTTFGLKFIDEAIAAQKPFYLHLCHNAPHFPLQAPAEDIATFRGKYRGGWTAISEARLRRQVEMGLIDKSWLKSPRPETIAQWDSLSAEDKDRFDHLMAVYAACVYHMDKSIGDLVDGLKKRAVLDNTLILFMSDNGGNAESGPNGRSNGEPTMADSNWFCGESWAYVQNTPFRLYKHYNHEGGIASPLVVHWPAGITAKNELRSQPSHLIDIMATCVDVGGAEYPKQHNGHSITPLEGRSLRPAFDNKSINRDALYWEHEGNAAVRVGDMKLVRQKAKGPWELYDLKSDRTEQHNLAEQQPGQVHALSEKWNAWAKRAFVTPSPNEASQGNEDAKQPKKKKKGKAK